MFKFIRNFSLFGIFLVASLFVTVNYSRYICSKPNSHCIGKKYIALWDEWWSRFEDNRIYITLLEWMHPSQPTDQQTEREQEYEVESS